MPRKDPFKVFHSKSNLFVRAHGHDDGSLFSQGEKYEILLPTLSQKRINAWLISIFFVLFIILLRMANIQILSGEKYRALAEENRIRIIRVLPDRGIILDRNNSVLVKNEPNFQLQIIPIDLPKNTAELDGVMKEIELLSKKSLSEISELITRGKEKNSYEPIIVSENLSSEEAILIKIASNTFPSIQLGIDAKRKYFNTGSESISHILGYLGKITEEELQKNSGEYSLNDSVGKAGIEFQYERELRGHAGKEEIEVDSFGKRIEKIARIDPVSGNNLILTIDMNIQKKLEEIIERVLRESRKKRASAIAMDPRTGEILALVSLPAYDNNLFSRGITPVELQSLLHDPDAPLFNRTIIGQYPSGSTLKPVIALAALEEGIATRNTSIMSVGGIQVNQWFFPDWKTGGHGQTNVTFALAESVNTYFYYIAGGYKNFSGLGIEKLVSYAQRAGIGTKTGVDLPSESSGLLPTPKWKEKTKGEKWYIGDTYHFAIGQGDILVTPLQVANWTAMVANFGTLYAPKIVKGISSDIMKLKKIPAQIIKKNTFSAENIKIVQEGMRDAVRYGSARAASDLPVHIAGKTGTAQWSTEKPNHAWFTSFAPYENPTIVLTILIEEGGEGSAVSVPAAIRFYQWWYEYDLEGPISAIQ